MKSKLSVLELVVALNYGLILPGWLNGDWYEISGRMMIDRATQRINAFMVQVRLALMMILKGEYQISV